MADSNARFAGSIPAPYDEGLGPMFFEPYARDLAKRLHVHKDATVLELAAGTGILTRHLIERLPRDARIVATDLNDAMLAVAKTKPELAGEARVEWRTADAGALPFPDQSFDAVVSQFGLMFFPDKAGALREARRVLKPGGTLLLNTWGSLGDNRIADIAHRTIAEFFHTNAPQFFTVPWGLHDIDEVTGLLSDAGFSSIEADTVDIMGESASATLAAKGLVLGTPVFTEIQERGTAIPEAIVHAVADRLSQEGGAAPMRIPMRARIFQARA